MQFCLELDQQKREKDFYPNTNCGKYNAALISLWAFHAALPWGHSPLPSQYAAPSGPGAHLNPFFLERRKGNQTPAGPAGQSHFKPLSMKELRRKVLRARKALSSGLGLCTQPHQPCPLHAPSSSGDRGLLPPETPARIGSEQYYGWRG